MALTTIDLTDLAKAPGMPGLTPARATTFVEAALVCFEKHGHIEGADMAVEISIPSKPRQRATSERIRLKYPHSDDQIRNTNDSKVEATEEGACAVAISIVHRLFGLIVLKRSCQTTGFDYWVGQKDTEGFQGLERLEVSGTEKKTEVERRVRQKLEQVARGSEKDSGLPHCVVVVEFRSPQTRIVRG